MDEITVTTPPEVDISQVIEWLLTGATEKQVAEALESKFPGVDVGRTMEMAQHYLGHAGRPDGDAIRGWALLSYRLLYQKMLETGDYNGCRHVVKEIVALVP